MRKRIVAGLVGALLGLSMAAPAGAQEVPIREPLIGLCLRPALYKVIDLPGLNLPAERIPWEPIALVLGGQFNDCR